MSDTQKVTKAVFSQLMKNSQPSKPIERNIVRPPRDEDNLFVQPKPEATDERKAKREMQERLNRMMFAEVFKYADKWTGNTATFHAVLVDRNAIAEKLLAARAETAKELRDEIGRL